MLSESDVRASDNDCLVTEGNMHLTRAKAKTIHEKPFKYVFFVIFIDFLLFWGTKILISAEISNVFCNFVAKLLIIFCFDRETYCFRRY